MANKLINFDPAMMIAMTKYGEKHQMNSSRVARHALYTFLKEYLKSADKKDPIVAEIDRMVKMSEDTTRARYAEEEERNLNDWRKSRAAEKRYLEKYGTEAAKQELREREAKFESMSAYERDKARLQFS